MANGFLDSMIALRVLYLLVQPITGLPAYKLGLIGPNGEILRKAVTPEEKKATSMLLRLVLRIRSFLSNIPFAQSKLGSYVTAYALVKECIAQDNYLPTKDLLESISTDLTQMEIEELNELYEEMYEEVLNEDAPTNSTGAGIAGADKPLSKKVVRRKAEFAVSSDTFNKFKKGKTKFQRWSKYLNLEDENEQKIYHYAKKNPRGVLVLKDDQGNSKGIRYSKHGGGNWHGIKRKPKQVVESFLSVDDVEIEVVDLDD